LGFIDGETALFKTELTLLEGRDGNPQLNWRPADSGMSLRNYFNLPQMQANKEEKVKCVSKLVSSLYKRDELEMSWDLGFCGHPSIGAPVMAKLRRDMETEQRPWVTLENRIKQAVQSQRTTRVVVVGSLFGATGSSGFPILPKVLRERSVKWGNPLKVHIGGIALLPYFRYEIPPESQDMPRVYGRPEFHLLNAKATVEFYDIDYEKNSPFNAVYLLGESAGQVEQKFAVGGNPQRNQFHFIDLLAALGVTDFLSKPAPELEKANEIKDGKVAVHRDRVNYYIAGRKNPDRLRWQDLPGHEDLQVLLINFLCVAIATQSFYYPLVTHQEFARQEHLIPWYCQEQFFVKEKPLSSQEVEEDFQQYLAYTSEFASWLYQIQSNDSVKVELLTQEARELVGAVARNPIPVLSSKAILNLWVGDSSTVGNGYARIWDKLCSSKKMSKCRKPVGRLITRLYDTISALNLPRFRSVARKEVQ
jgi:hypothetical protein